MNIRNLFYRPFLFFTVAFLCASHHVQASENDWPQWRGPNRDGISHETGLLKIWPDEGPEVLWRVPAGAGYSGMSVKDGKLVTSFAKQGDEYLLCFNADSGEEIWRYRMDSQFNNNFGNGSRSTPTIDENAVFAISAKGTLVAVDFTTGAEVWKHHLKTEYGATIPTWGVSTSPLVDGDRLIVDVGGKNGYGLVAFHKKTGKVLWKAPESLPGYSAPIAVTVEGKKQIISFSGNALISVNAENGRQYWSVPWITSYDVNAATPIFVAPDKLFVSSGYGKGGALLKMIPQGKDVNVETVWSSTVMRNHFSTCVLVDGYLYGFDEGTLKCVNVNTQETKWGKRGLGKGSLIFADGHLIVLSERGKLVLVEANPENYVEKAEAQMLRGRCWTIPTLVDGKLYIRNQKEMLCLNVSAGGTL